MKQIETNCQVCGSAMKIEIEPSEFFTDSKLIEMATCESCYDSHDSPTRDRIAKYHKAIEREMEEVRKPYKED